MNHSQPPSNSPSVIPVDTAKDENVHVALLQYVLAQTCDRPPHGGPCMSCGKSSQMHAIKKLIASVAAASQQEIERLTSLAAGTDRAFQDMQARAERAEQEIQRLQQEGGTR